MKTRLFILIVGALVAILVWLFVVDSETPPHPVACTMEARICPDGSAVGRTGPNCEFAECKVSEIPIEEPSVPDIVACTMDVQSCPDGSFVGRVAPSCAFAPCPQESSLDNLIRVTTPTPQSSITSPATITGTARGSWFFEGSFPVSIVNWDGLIIGEGIATAEGEWMTEDFVPFTASISYTIDPQTPYNRGAVILKKDNPSGLPEHDAALEIPVTFNEISQ